MSDFGVRLKEERKRLGLNQDAMAGLGGLKRMAQLNYEKGERFPDSAYLGAIASAGADVHYILTGRRQVTMTDEENALLAAYRSATPALQSAALVVLGAGDSAHSPKKSSISIAGDVGQVVKSKKLDQRGISFTLNADKAKRSKARK